MSDEALRNAAADAAASNLESAWFALVNDGTQVSNERLHPAYGTSSAGAVALSGALAFTGTGAVTHLAVYAAEAGGSPRFTVPLSGDLAFNSAGELTLTAAPITVT